MPPRERSLVQGLVIGDRDEFLRLVIVFDTGFEIGIEVAKVGARKVALALVRDHAAVELFQASDQLVRIE